MKKIIITANNVSEVDLCTKYLLEQSGFYVEEYPDAFKYKPEEIIYILKDAEAVIAGLEPYTREILDHTPSLKLIARRGVGVDNIDLNAAQEHGILVTRTKGLVGSSVSELIMSYLLDHARMLSSHNATMKQGVWLRNLSEGVQGKTLGLVGFGSIAKETAVRANAFGMNVLTYHRHQDSITEQAYHVKYVDFYTLVTTSDYISINVPLTEETNNMFHKKVFDLMKPSSVLINTARSGIVNTEDLVSALKSKTINGAYIDVYDREPCIDSPLLSCDNATLTPHIGTFTRETFIAMNNRCAEQIIEFFLRNQQE